MCVCVCVYIVCVCVYAEWGRERYKNTNTYIYQQLGFISLEVSIN